MAVLLFPGRHLLNTRFQDRYLRDQLPLAVAQMALLGAKGRCTGRIDEVIFVITSANQSHSRYNPIPLEVRAVAVDRFARSLREEFGVRFNFVPIPHYGPSPRFAEILLKELTEATEGKRAFVPENTILLSSTPELIHQFVALGFGVLPAELASENPLKYVAMTPIDVMKEIVKAGDAWGENAVVRQNVSAATMSVWNDFPDVMRRVLRLYRDPLLTEEGSLTEMRNYSTYAVGMGDRAILELKYNDIRQAIVPGRIADEGCADGALLVPIARDFPDSDLIGIEITGEFMARCIERQRALEYGGTYIHFHQRNITEAIFQPESIDTTICNSTTHELWSYGDQEKTLLAYLKEKYRQTRKGGRLVIRDVVGLEEGDEEVLLWCNDADGSNTDIHKACGDMETLTPHVAGLSTAARFERFAVDYLADQRERRKMPGTLRFEKVTVDGRQLFRLRLLDAMEYLMKKDYADNWKSELNEEFTFWSFSYWKQVLGEIGFRVRENPNDPKRWSRAYSSEWIVKNRFEGKVTLYRQEGGKLVQLAWPVTNMVLVGEK
jgi:hypothetical protein